MSTPLLQVPRLVAVHDRGARGLAAPDALDDEEHRDQASDGNGQVGDADGQTGKLGDDLVPVTTTNERRSRA